MENLPESLLKRREKCLTGCQVYCSYEGSSKQYLYFSCSADHERDWPPCKVVLFFVFFGLTTNARNVKNNKTIKKKTERS